MAGFSLATVKEASAFRPAQAALAVSAFVGADNALQCRRFPNLGNQTGWIFQGLET
jgi:hypothetical protein